MAVAWSRKKIVRTAEIPKSSRRGIYNYQ